MLFGRCCERSLAPVLAWRRGVGEGPGRAGDEGGGAEGEEVLQALPPPSPLEAQRIGWAAAEGMRGAEGRALEGHGWWA